MLYGAGDLRAGKTVDPDEADEYTVRTIGREVKQALISGIAGFADCSHGSIGKTNCMAWMVGRCLFAKSMWH